jgi:phosphatidylserine/phosphatidylglycerophosphate/cardiolipin synthase-like enzyme
MAARASAPGGPFNPWDDGCKVTTYVGGLAAMRAMRQSLELAITEAEAASALPIGQRGRVYITDWRFNCLRDLSEDNPWGTDKWDSFLGTTNATHDQTALGLVLRLMKAGVMVRVMIWFPPAVSGPTAGFAAHIADHRYAAEVVSEHNILVKPAGAGEEVGIVALDMRTADSTVTSSHHQKTMVIRGAATSVAYVGGVDLAYTRRDAGPLEGDWESGATIPDPTQGWPHTTENIYTAVANVKPFSDRQPSDLPAAVYGDGSSLLTRHMWHDQHLRLEGPIVKTLEYQFKERWEDTTNGRLFDIDGPYSSKNWRAAQVIFSTPAAFDTNGVKPLPLPQPQAAVTGSPTHVQMWRTIPYRTTRTGPPFERAEFTVMAGIANAVKAATQFILMFDQYFWSRPLARLLNKRLKDVATLRLIVVLPPNADSQEPVAHSARAKALDALTAGLAKTGDEFDQVGVYNLWLDRNAAAASSRNRGIYVHAKAHTYDGDLLVCGSANLNRRSFACDSEIACAVLDPAVVAAHQAQLWEYLFDQRQRPNVDFTAAGAGQQLFDDFRNKAKTGTSILIPDPWRDADPQLPNGVKRDQTTWVFGETRYEELLDPSSVTTTADGPVYDLATHSRRDPRLDDIVNRLEHVHFGTNFPYRRS